MSTPPPGGGPGSGTFSGIDPGRLKGLIDSLGDAARILKSANGWNGRFAEHGVDTGGLTRLVGVGNWAERQLPTLKRRFDLAAAYERNHPEPGRKMVRIPDNFRSLQEAQRLGRELAGRMNRVNRTDQGGAQEIHRIAGELERYQDDPELMAAFYASVNPNWLSTLPSYMTQSGSTTAGGDLKIFSRALGTATSAKYLATPGFDKVNQAMLRPSEHPSDAWSRLALMQYGHFPTEYLKTAAKNLALDQFDKEPDGRDWRGGNGFDATKYGLSDDNLALALNLLGKDGAAARQVLGGMQHGDIKKTYDLFLDYAKGYGTGDQVAAGLGKAVEAGSGVGSEKPGHHSLEASRFAFDALTHLGSKGKDIPWSMKVSMGNLGASYIHELTSGARDDIEQGRSSSMSRPAMWDDVAGINPAFYLSRNDVDNFMRTFAGSRPAIDAFDRGAGQFSDHVLTHAAKTDSGAVRAGQDDPEELEHAAAALGQLAAAEYRAQRDAGRDMDKQAAAVRGVMKDVFTLGLGEVPIASKAGEYAWKGALFGLGKLTGAWAQGNNPNEKRADQEFDNFQLLQQFRITKYLYDAGYPVSSPPPEELLNPDGTIKSFEQLRQDAQQEGGRDAGAAFRKKLNALATWSDSTRDPNTHNGFDWKAYQAGKNLGDTDPH